MCVTYQTVSNWERDVSVPDIDSIKKLCEIFTITSDELIGCNKSDYKETKKERLISQTFTEKSKVARLLGVLVCIMIVSYFFSSVFSATSIKKTVLVSFLSLLANVSYFISTLGAFVCFLIGKKYSEKKIFILLFYCSVALYVVLVIITLSVLSNKIIQLYNIYGSKITNSQLNNLVAEQKLLYYLDNICFFGASVSFLFAFESKFRDKEILRLEIAYLVCCTLSLLVFFVLQESFTLFYVISFVLAYLIKKDKTVEIPYNFYGTTTSKYDLVSQNSEPLETEKGLEVKLKLSHVLGGTFLKVVIIALFVFITFVPNADFVNDNPVNRVNKKDLYLLFGVLPFIFYFVCLVLKKSQSIKFSIFALLVILAYLIIQICSFQRTIQSNDYDTIRYGEMIITACLQCFFVWIYAFKYSIGKRTFSLKILPLIINIISALAFICLSIINPSGYLGFQFLSMLANMLVVMLLSFSYKDLIN